MPLSLLLGPVWRAVSPVRTINAARRARSAGDPRRGPLRLPRPAGLLAGRARAVRVRVDRAGLPPRHRAGPGAAVVRGVRRGDARSAARCSATRSTTRPTRSRSTRPCCRSCRSGSSDRDGRPAWSAARWPTLDACRPPRAGRRWCRCCSAARRSTRSGLDAVGAVRPVHATSTPTLLNNLALLAFCVARRPDLRGRHDGHRRRAGHDPARTCPTCSRTRSCRSWSGYIVAHYLTYLVEVGQQTLIQLSDPLANGSNCSAPRTGRSTTGCPTTRPRWPRPRCWRWWSDTWSASIAAHDRAIRLLPKRPAHRPAAPAPADGGLHGRRALPALRRVGTTPPHVSAREPGPPSR